MLVIGRREMDHYATRNFHPGSKLSFAPRRQRYDVKMIIALLADIHANREALTACLADAMRRNVDRYIFMGDFVGYVP